MNAATETVPADVALTHGKSASKRVAVLVYGVVSYGAGVAALVAWIASMLGVLPFTGGPLELSGNAAVALNVALMLGFALQHSIMARPKFKERWTKLIPPAAERSTFVLATGLVLGPLVYLWQPMPATIWDVQLEAARFALIGLAVVGWAYLFLATFAVNHFELFGLRQVYQYFRGQPVTPVPFKERWMYGFDRHPIMTGALMGLWITPTMHADHLLFACLATLYIVIGVHFEERALRRQWGDTYEDYRSRVRSLVPTFSRKP